MTEILRHRKLETGLEPTGAVPGGTYAGQGALGGIGEGEFPYLRPARLYSAQIVGLLVTETAS